MVELGAVNRFIRAYTLAGFCVASYALYVESSLENDPNFEPLCDVRPYVKCSSAFVSPYAKGFGIIRYLFGEDAFVNVPNGLAGMIFYVLSFALSCSDNSKIVKLHYCMAIASNLSTIYLAIILMFVIKELCLVCLMTYFINALSLLSVASKQRLIMMHCSKSKDE